MPIRGVAANPKVVLALIRIARLPNEGKRKAKNMSQGIAESGFPALPRWTIALDGGTTNTRARLLHGEQIVATCRNSVGARDTVRNARAAEPPASAEVSDSHHRPGRRLLEDAIRELVAELRAALNVSVKPGSASPSIDLIVAAGMLSSEAGLAEVPHLMAPAGLGELAAGMVVRSFPAIAEEPIWFVPGVRSPAGPGPEGWTRADVMRGEESETLGAYHHLLRRGRIDPAQGAARFLWPGSHTKLVELDALGRIVGSHTTLAGELFEAIGRHTLVSSSLPDRWPDELDDATVATAEKIVSAEGLGRAAFLVRVADLTHALVPEQRAAFLLAAIVAEDVRSLAGHLGAENRPIWVGGRQPLRDLYTRFLQARLPGPVVPIEDELAEAASALGALAIANRRRELDLEGRDRTLPLG